MTESAPEHQDRDRNSASPVNQDQHGSSDGVDTVGIDAKVLLGDSAKVESSTPGGFLRQERERQERPLQNVADELHLSRQAIEAIEGNRFAEFGAPVFAKGHLRRYAILLGISVDDVFQRYEKLSDSARAHESLPPSARPQESRRVELNREATGLRIAPRTSGSGTRWLPIAALLALVACAVGAWWWLSDYTASPALPTTQAISDTPAIEEDEPDIAATTETKPAEAPIAESPTVATVPTPAPTSAPTITQRPASTSPMPGKVRVRLVFKQDSWAEVYDGRGNRMMYDVGRSDLPRVIDADPPVQVVLGYSPAVNVEINGAAITVPERRVNNSVARFTVQADGSIQ